MVARSMVVRQEVARAAGRLRTSRAWPMPSDPGLVLPGPRVDPDRVALVHEDRHLHDQAGLRPRRLSGTGLGVAGEARLGLLDDEVDGDRQLDADRLALVAQIGRASCRERGWRLGG